MKSITNFDFRNTHNEGNERWALKSFAWRPGLPFLRRSVWRARLPPLPLQSVTAIGPAESPGRSQWQVAIDKGWLKEAGLDRPAFNRIRLKAEKSIGSRVLEQSTSKWTQVALTLSCSGRRTFLTKNSAASLSGGGRPLPLSSIWRWRNGNDLVSVESAASTRLVAVFMTRSRPRLLAAALIA